MSNMTNESSAEFNSLRSRHGLSPGKDLETLTIAGNGVADVFVTPERAQAALVKAGEAQGAWTDFNANHTPESPLGLVGRRALKEASLVGALANQVLSSEDRSGEVANLEAELFGYYSPELFAGAVAQKIRSIEALSLPVDLEPSRAIILEELDQLIEGIDVTELQAPSEHTLKVVGVWLYGQFGDLFDEMDESGRTEFDAEQIVRYFQSGIDSTPSLRRNHWKASSISREKNAISTYASRKEIVIPETRVVKRENLKGLIVHEVFGHALRSAIAEENDIPTGQNGTATYARFEESFMIALEQCLSGAHNPTRGMNHYLAVGLSVTGGYSKDKISRLFESMSMLEKAKSGIDDNIRLAAVRAAKLQISRTFVGFTDVDEGVAHRKDIDYLHGLNDSWGLLNYIVAHDAVDEALPWLFSAKFNPFTKSERELVDSFVPMPPVLRAYFENTLV